MRQIMVAVGLCLLAIPAQGQEFMKIVASDGVSGDRFGSSIAVDGDTLLVGAPYKESWEGKAYGFAMPSGTQVHELKAADAGFGDKFGWQVALTPSRYVVSSPNDTDIQGVTSEVGSLALFERCTGVSLGKLWAADRTTFDQLGFSLAADGERVVAGAIGDRPGGVWSGSAYVFDLQQGTQIKLVPSDGEDFDSFGYCVGISGSFVVVGAPFADRAATDSGSVYVFDASTGAELFQLQAFGGLDGDAFGASLALDGNLLAVSSAGSKQPRLPLPSHLHTSVRLFDLQSRQELFGLRIEDAPGDQMGFDGLAMDGRHVLVGMPLANEPNVWSGAAYLMNSGTGRQIDKLLPSDPSDYKFLGRSLAFSPTFLFLGADADLLTQGSVYLYARP